MLAVPRGHAPEALEDGLFAEGEVEEGAVDGVLFVVAFGVFVAGDVFELLFLRGKLVLLMEKGEGRPYDGRSVGQPHEHAAFPGILP